MEKSNKYRTVFLHGILHRSGTNYLNRLLLNHADLVKPSFTIRENWFLAFSDYLEIYKNKLNQKWSNPKWSGDPVPPSLLNYTFANGFNEILHYNINSEKTLLTKTPSVKNLGHFNKYFPDSKLIILVRQPHDILYSSLKTFNWPLKKTSRKWNLASEEIIKAEEILDEESYLLVRYEDLVINQEEQLNKILKFLDLDNSRFDWDKIKTTPIVGSSNNNNYWTVQKHSKSFTSIGKWKNLKKKRFNLLNRDYLDYFGYNIKGEIKDYPSFSYRKNLRSGLKPLKIDKIFKRKELVNKVFKKLMGISIEWYHL